ncbi:MAG: superoxide dismutase [Candidatus Paceibacterota bacterium]|jgi:Fe-Mn family superoxide dismutase|nr:superoxide dismutase [Candidatus Paceibacterota bacterium]
MYEPKNYEHLLGLAGFSDALLKNHFTLYGGYVANVNKLAEKSETIEVGSPEYSELKRRFAWEWNGMHLHELYFENLSVENQPFPEDGELYKKIAERFGSYENWEKDFRATGAMRGIGWVILAYHKEEGRLFNIWVNEHDVGLLSGTAPLLVMDVFEHAFMLDYGLRRADYVEAFWQAIDWKKVEERFAQ